MLSGEEWSILRFTVAVSILSTLLILPFGTALAWILARKSWRGKSIIETLISLPLVMPPVATGLLLLKILGRKGWLGDFFSRVLDINIVFTWRAVVIAMAVMSFPLLVRTARVAFEEVNPRMEQVARTLGAGQLSVFFTITLPLAIRGVVAGALLAYARALGEFGATILVAGNIPGRTSTLSVSTYYFIQMGRDREAFQLVAISILLAFAAVWLSEFFFKKSYSVK
jgi:molybdate transport system permease protein